MNNDPFMGVENNNSMINDDFRYITVDPIVPNDSGTSVGMNNNNNNVNIGIGDRNYTLNDVDEAIQDWINFLNN